MRQVSMLTSKTLRWEKGAFFPLPEQDKKQAARTQSVKRKKHAPVFLWGFAFVMVLFPGCLYCKEAESIMKKEKTASNGGRMRRSYSFMENNWLSPEKKASTL